MVESKRPEHYSNQPRYVRAYRWMRFKPYYTAVAYCKSLLWIATGARIPHGVRDIFETRREYLAHILMCHRSLAAHRMGDYLTLEELIDELHIATEGL